ncbi:XdhC family protein [Pedobacter sp. JCM 36344]|uniref:XdhC family protein n=1 Tax=Pedobacter sp. JCM 36344 TaxID=3374280 RepID=UPI00397C612E
MKEIKDILKAYDLSIKTGQKAALATVVKVEGSSYRRPGARMLITEDGMLTGAISGGCLEGDALRKALSAIHQQENKLVTYDTTDEDDAKFGVQLGCNGIVRILFEPIKSDAECNPIDILALLEAGQESAVLVTLFSLTSVKQIGSSLLYGSNLSIQNSAAVLPHEVITDAEEVLTRKRSTFKSYTVDGQSLEAFLELVNPPISLIIAGAGNDAQPLAQIADILGWQTTIIDGRPTHATALRFPTADKIRVLKPEQVLSNVKLNHQTAFVLMTHNYNYDLELLNLLLQTNARYIGTLGPKKKLIRMLEELQLATDENLSRIYGPIGLDIGAETAEEIAISIIAEIKSVFSGASTGFLKEKTLPIHTYNINLDGYG